MQVIVCFTQSVFQKKLASFRFVPNGKMCRLNHLTFNHLTTVPPSEPHMSGLSMSAKPLSLRNMLCNGFYTRSVCDFRNILRYVFQGRLQFYIYKEAAPSYSCFLIAQGQTSQQASSFYGECVHCCGPY